MLKTKEKANMNTHIKHVVHMFWSLTYGGVETMLVNIMNTQYQKGVKVSLVLINDNYDKDLLGSFHPEIEVHLLKRKAGSKSLKFIWRLNSLLDEIHPDHIHLHSSKLFLTLRNRYKSISCLTLHSLPTGKIRQHTLISKLFPFIDIFGISNVRNIDKIGKVYSISRGVQSQLKKLHGVDSDVIYNGIKIDTFKVRNNNQLSRLPLRIVQVSRLDYNVKGQDIAIRAVAQLGGKVCIDFIGGGDDLTYLQSLSTELHATKYVRFLGQKSQSYIADHLCDYDLFLQPSRVEGFGLTVAEAMAAGLPVLVSSNDGPLEIINGGEFGWTFENGDIDSLCDKLNYIVDNYSLALEKTNQARKRISDCFNVENTAINYLKAY